MVNLVLRFISCSRAAGLRISSSETLDCLRHLELIDVLDEPLFKNVLRSNFAKSRREQGRFDHLYHLFFHELRSGNSIPITGELSDRIDEVLRQIEKQEHDDSAYQAIAELLKGNPLRYMEEMRRIQTDSSESVSHLPNNFGPLVRRLQVMSQITSIGDTVARFMSSNIQAIPWEERNALTLHFNDRLENARRMLREDPEPYNDELNQVTSYEQHMNEMGNRSFFSLSRKEVVEMREIIEQMVRKLKDTVQRRHVKNSRGVLDIKKTLRASMKYQGVPVEIIFKHRPKRKGKIVTLCDVSGSVWSAAKFMLNMLYSLQDCFLQVRSFVFVSELEEVTKIFEDHDINKAIDKALSDTKINYEASTDYGSSFRQFRREHLDILNKKTTLIIIGDARSNYGNPEVEILDEMREKCRRVIWLNPESLMFWNTGDSVMRDYQPYCNQVRHCQNLNQLTDFIKTLVL